MKTALLSCLFLCAAFSCAHVALSDYDRLELMDTNFDQGSYAPWEAQYSTENYSLIVTNDAPRAGTCCCRFTIGAGGDYWTSPFSGLESARSEIQLYNVAPYHREVYYGWSMKIPAGYAESGDWQVVGQFHDQPDTREGESWSTYPAHSPPLAYNYKDGYLRLAMSTPDNVVRVICEKPITTGEWHDIVTRVYWSDGNDGFVEAWVDGEHLSVDGQTRYYHPNLYNKAGNYLKIGLYRSKDILTENTIFFDEIKSGFSYDEAVPD